MIPAEPTRPDPPPDPDTTQQPPADAHTTQPSRESSSPTGDMPSLANRESQGTLASSTLPPCPAAAPTAAEVGRYIVVQPHAEGGMSEVYRGNDTELQRGV